MKYFYLVFMVVGFLSFGSVSVAQEKLTDPAQSDKAAPINSASVANLETRVCGVIHPTCPKCGSNAQVVHLAYGIYPHRNDGCSFIDGGGVKRPHAWFCVSCRFTLPAPLKLCKLPPRLDKEPKSPLCSDCQKRLSRSAGAWSTRNPDNGPVDVCGVCGKEIDNPFIYCDACAISKNRCAYCNHKLDPDGK